MVLQLRDFRNGATGLSPTHKYLLCANSAVWLAYKWRRKECALSQGASTITGLHAMLFWEALERIQPMRTGCAVLRSVVDNCERHSFHGVFDQVPSELNK